MLVELAVRKGWKLLELHSREATLESLFLEVTGDGAGDGKAAAS